MGEGDRGGGEGSTVRLCAVQSVCMYFPPEVCLLNLLHVHSLVSEWSHIENALSGIHLTLSRLREEEEEAEWVKERRDDGKGKLSEGWGKGKRRRGSVSPPGFSHFLACR